MKALIFDFDGVIADSEPTHEIAFRETAESIGLPLSPELYTEIVGLDDVAVFRAAAKEAGRQLSDEELAGLTSTKQSRFLALVEEGHVEAFSGSLELIRAAARELPIAVCSGAVRIEVERVLTKLGVIRDFECVVTADDVEHAKPDPSGYVLTAKKLGVEPSACAAIEDTDKGIMAGKAAGLRVAAVCHSLPAPRLSQADLVVDSILELSVERLRSL